MSKSAEKILVTAQNLFNFYSFTGVGVDLIRDQSGCSKTTMYTYFKNKNQLILEVLKKRHLFFVENLTQAVSTATGRDAIIRLWGWHVGWFCSEDFKGCLFVRAMAETTYEQNEIQEVVRAHKDWLKQLFLSYSVNGDLIYIVVEGLISHFLVNGYDAQFVLKMWQKIEKLI